MGLLYFAVIFLLNSASKKFLFRNDPLIKLKRLTALSLFSLVIWTFFVTLGVVFDTLFVSPPIWFKLMFVGLSVAVAARFMILSVLSFTSKPVILSFSFIEPLSISLLAMHHRFHYLAENLSYYIIHASLYILVSLIGVTLYMKLINREGLKNSGFPSITLFKAFLANWMENLNTPLENLLEEIGNVKDVKVSSLLFRSGGKPKAVVVVPMIHPGPFKNLGSSALPSLLADALERKLDCVAMIPHSLSGHELNLTSQTQNSRVIEHILNAPQPQVSSNLSSPPQNCRIKDAEARCQIFGRCAFITLTMFPKTIEDLPPELDEYINEEAEKMGLSCAIVVDAHNSIDGSFNSGDALEMLREAAVESMRMALNQNKSRFEIGSSKILIEEFGVKEGVGPGGISVLTVKVRDEKFAYILIDGNNMISGLRDKILSSLHELGINGGEVMTTDTHVVNGVVVTKRGWHPVGEAIDEDKLISYIRKCVMQALSNSEPAEVSWSVYQIPQVKVIGEEQIDSLCLSTDTIIRKAKTLASTIFPVSGIVISSILILM